MNIAIGCYYNKTLFDPDYQTNVLDVSETAGFTLPKYKTLQYQNRLMKDMKNIGFYQIGDTLANFAVGSLGYEQFRMIDWKKTGNIYTPYGGLTYHPGYILGNGVNAYMDTNFNIGTMGENYTPANASRTIGVGKYSGYFTTTSGATLDGVRYNYVYNCSYSTTSTNTPQRINSALAAHLDLSQEGIKFLSRVNENVHVINNNTQSSAASDYNSILPDSNQIILARGVDDPINTPGYSMHGVNIYALGAAIPYPMSQQFRTIYNQYLSNVGLDAIA